MSRNQRSNIHNLINSHESVRPPFGTFVENGRTYAYTAEYVYPFPIDELEAEALDMFHNFIHGNAMKGKLYQAELMQCPAGNGPRQVLDIGFGTGNWCYDMADKHPEMHIHGIDFFARQPRPERACPNNTFHSINFTDDTWGDFQEGAFDFVRAARLCGSVPDWNHLHQRIYKYLKPGGFVEHVEIDWTPHVIPGYHCPSAALLFEWWHYVQEASKRRGPTAPTKGLDMAFPKNMKDMLEDAGFSMCNHRTFDISFLRHPSLRKDSVYDHDMHVMEAFLPTLCMGARNDLPMSTLEGLSMSFLTGEGGRSAEQARSLCANVRKVLMTEGLAKDLPMYFNLHVITARKRMI